MLRAIGDLAEAQRRETEWIASLVEGEAAWRITSEGTWLRIDARDWASLPEALARRLPEAEFRFLPGPDELTDALADHPRFHFLEKYSLAPTRFLSQVDVLCIPVRRDWPTMQGPRCLIEAMAAGVPAVMVDRDGPRDRIAHGETGFVTNDLAQMADYVAQLVDDGDLRRQFGQAARARARLWKVEHWVDALLQHSGG